MPRSPALETHCVCSAQRAALRSALHPALVAGSHCSALYPPSDDALLRRHAAPRRPVLLEQADPANGQVLDRAYADNTDGKLRSSRPLSSIAATGFGLSTLLHRRPSRAYLPHADILERVRDHAGLSTSTAAARTRLLLALQRRPHRQSRRRAARSLPSTPAILLCGVLTARAYFHDARITRPRHRNLRAGRLAMDAQRRQQRSPWAFATAHFSTAAGTTTAN